ncbi:hypothetical protein [Moorena producens]|uniref:hypothetical protein n=1 Tax=Moorena producens TaxID=1155739 RepID=UPI003C72DA6B
MRLLRQPLRKPTNLQQTYNDIMNTVEIYIQLGSQEIKYLEEDSSKYTSVEVFYNAAIHTLYRDYHSKYERNKHIENSNIKKITLEELHNGRRGLSEVDCLNFDFKDAIEQYSLYSDWNILEFVFKTKTKIHFFSWSTSE